MFTTWVYIHVGKDTTLDDSSGVTQVVVLKLVEGLEHKGHHLYCDNYYTSPNLFSSLRQVGFGAWILLVGTGGECPQKSAAKLKGEMTTCEVETGMLALKWMDKRPVTMLSTIHDDSMLTKCQRSRLASGGIE